MAQIPTTAELTTSALTVLESRIGQTSPVNDKAFLRVLAAVLSLAHTGMYRTGIERTQQNLAQTATVVDLDRLGREVYTFRKSAEACRLTATIDALNGTVIEATNGFIGAANGILYLMDGPATASSGTATLQLTAEVTGPVGNLQPDDTLSIVSPVAGAANTALVTTVTNTGAYEETDTAYRSRVLFAQRATLGGSNSTDHKVWAEEVAGVYRAFPYAGKPHALGLVSFPGDRTVYVECDSTVDADGVPGGALLDEVRAALATDPVTGRARPVMGLLDSSLYVEPILRTPVTVEISGFTAPLGQSATVQSDVATGLDGYLRTLSPYIEGIDLPQERNDLITDLTIADIVQSILSAYGASATRVRFRTNTTPYISQYRIEPGELTKLSTVVYV